MSCRCRQHDAPRSHPDGQVPFGRPMARMASRLALPPGVSPQCRRVRAEGPLPQETLDACVAKFRRSPGFKANSPIVATFATSVHDPWLLGLSAAKLGLPVVIAGLGRSFPSHFSWWLGYAKKFPGSVRAAQVLRALAPRAPVIWVDSTDTVLVNPVVGSAARAISDVVGSVDLASVTCPMESLSRPRSVLVTALLLLSRSSSESLLRLPFCKIPLPDSKVRTRPRVT